MAIAIDDIPPRLAGVLEQFERTHWLLGSARGAADADKRFRIHILATYPARAITEIMLEAVEHHELNGMEGIDAKERRKEFEDRHLAGLPYYALIEKIRIHDFHRFGLRPQLGLAVGGPIKFRGGPGEAAIAFPLHGPGGKQVVATGRSKVIEQRPLAQQGMKFLDDASAEYKSLDEILTAYLGAVGPVIGTFRSLLK